MCVRFSPGPRAGRHCRRVMFRAYALAEGLGRGVTGTTSLLHSLCALVKSAKDTPPSTQKTRQYPPLTTHTPERVRSFLLPKLCLDLSLRLLVSFSRYSGRTLYKALPHLLTPRHLPKSPSPPGSGTVRTSSWDSGVGPTVSPRVRTSGVPLCGKDHSLPPRHDWGAQKVLESEVRPVSEILFDSTRASAVGPQVGPILNKKKLSSRSPSSRSLSERTRAGERTPGRTQNRTRVPGDRPV